MSANGSFDDVTPGPETGETIKNEANREVVTFLANLVVESRHQLTTLRNLYNLLRDMDGKPPIAWQAQLVHSQEQHITRVSEHVSGLKAALRSGG